MSVYEIDGGAAKGGRVHILPAAVNFDGVVPNGTNTWKSTEEKTDGRETNFLRGRKLVGEATAFADGASVPVVFTQVAGKPPGEGARFRASQECTDCVIYSHEGVGLGADNPLLRAAEWLEISNAINGEED